MKIYLIFIGLNLITLSSSAQKDSINCRDVIVKGYLIEHYSKSDMELREKLKGTGQFLIDTHYQPYFLPDKFNLHEIDSAMTDYYKIEIWPDSAIRKVILKDHFRIKSRKL